MNNGKGSVLGTGLDGARVAPLKPVDRHLLHGHRPQQWGRSRQRRLSRISTPRRSSAPDAGPQQGWFTKEEKVLGGIGVGRFADLVVLSKNFFDEREVPVDQIRSMNSILTICERRDRLRRGGAQDGITQESKTDVSGHHHKRGVAMIRNLTSRRLSVLPNRSTVSAWPRAITWIIGAVYHCVGSGHTGQYCATLSHSRGSDHRAWTDVSRNPAGTGRDQFGGLRLHRRGVFHLRHRERQPLQNSHCCSAPAESEEVQRDRGR